MDLRRTAALVCAALASACHGDGGDPPAEVSACEALTRNPPARAALQAEAVTAEATPAGVAHCRVTGQLDPRTGSDGKPYHIGFELRLPDDWNGRFLFQGGGGNDGIIRPALGTQATTSPALGQGYAVVSTDAGHQGADASFGLDPQARVDHAYRSYDRVAQTAKALIERHYGKPAEYAYFIGCSGGGRQAMMFTQRFPDTFDGVIAMAPAMSVARGATAAAAANTQTVARIAPRTEAGEPILAQAFSDAELGLLRERILARCDADDGLVDGLVSRPAACRFDPAELQCDGSPDATACLAPEKVDALRELFAPRTTPDGAQYYAGWPWDPGVGHPANDWRAWRLGTSPTGQSNARNITLMADALAHEFFTPPEPGFDLLDFDPVRDLPRMDAYAAIYNTNEDARLDAYKASGGKLLLATGMADPIFSPLETIDYHERLRAAHPNDADAFARLYLIPGMAHCQGGAATDVWDGLGAIARWVERGEAPAAIQARGSAVYPGRTRPLCPYPSYARYQGEGDPESAQSFACATP